MKRFILYFSVVISVISTSIFILPTIERITSFSQAQVLLNQADQETLVVFDVDDTLIRPVDKILQRQYSSLDSWKFVETKLNQFIEENEHLHLASTMCMQTKRELIEPSVAQLIATLQERGIKVLACTLWRVGPYGEIPLLEELRFKQLKDLAVDFTSSFNTTQIFNQFQHHYTCSPLVYKGILFTNLCPKGEVLGAFLDTLDWKPRQIIFFDDLLSNLVSVHNELR